MKRLGEFLFVRNRRSWLQLFRFGIVGASGVVVNMLVLIMIRKVGPPDKTVFQPIPFTEFNVQWYHLYLVLAFLVANLWNFQVNRTWTFGSGKHAGWISEYLPFLLVGLVGMAANLGIATLLMHRDFVFALPTSIFDGSSGLRTPLYWANLAGIAVATPLTFVINKLWTFRAVRGLEKQVPGDEPPAVADPDTPFEAEADEARVAAPDSQTSGLG